jgi:membrane-bound serine protease (ClpP class)
MAAGLLLVSLWSAFGISAYTGLVFILIDLALMPIVIMIAASIWPHTPIARFFMLKPPGQDDHFRDPQVEPYQQDLHALVGHVGRALTDLKPGGTVLVASQPIDALTDEGYIKADTVIKVIGTRQSQLLVRSA